MTLVKASQVIRGTLDQSAYLCLGNQTALLEQFRRQWLKTIQKKHSQVELIQLSIQKQDDLHELKQHMNSYGLFSRCKCIQVMIDTSTFKKHDSLLSLLKMPPQDTYLLATMPKFEKKQKTNKWFKNYEQCLTLIECTEPTGSEREFWIKRSLKQHRLKLSDDQKQWLTDATHGHLSSAIQEIQKLALLAQDEIIDDTIMRKALSQSSLYTPFELMDAIHGGHIAKSLSMANHLLTQENLPLITWALNQEVRLLLALKIASIQGKPTLAIFKQFRVWSSQQSQMSQRAQHFTLQHLQNLFRLTALLDRQFKGSVGSAKATALTLVTELCSRKEMPASSPLLTH